MSMWSRFLSVPARKQRRRAPISLSRRAFIGVVMAVATIGGDYAEGSTWRLRVNSGGLAPPPSGPFAGVAPETMIMRAAVAAEWDTAWPGYQDQVFANEGSVPLITTPAGLESGFRALHALPGYSPSNWYLIRLDSSRPATGWTSTRIRGYLTTVPEPIVEIGHLYGSTWDYASAGGGVVIESSDPENPVTFQDGFTIQGVRGVHIRNVNFANRAPTFDRDAEICVAINANSSSAPEAPVVRLEDCGFGLGFHASGETDPRQAPVCIRNSGGVAAQIDVINCRFLIGQTGITTAGTRLLRVVNCDFQQTVGDGIIKTHTLAVVRINSNFSETCFAWTRANTIRNWAEDPTFSAEHSDGQQTGTSGDAAVANQNGYFCLSEFDIYEGYRVQGTDDVDITFTSTLPVANSTVTLNGTTYTFVTGAPATNTQIQIGASAGATRTNFLNTLAANLPPGVVFVYAAAATVARVCYTYNLWTPIIKSTVPAANLTIDVKPTRRSGGTQGDYNDDTPTAQISNVRICCAWAGNDGISHTLLNGTSITDRCVAFRPKKMALNATIPVSGFIQTLDYTPYMTSSRIAGYSVPINHTIRNCIMQFVRDNGPKPDLPEQTRTANGVYTAPNAILTMVGNEFYQWDDGSAGPGSVVEGTFFRDPTDANKWCYDLQTDGANSMQAFREEVYSVLKSKANPANVGITDPATWGPILTV